MVDPGPGVAAVAGRLGTWARLVAATLTACACFRAKPGSSPRRCPAFHNYGGVGGVLDAAKNTLINRIGRRSGPEMLGAVVGMVLYAVQCRALIHWLRVAYGVVISAVNRGGRAGGARWGLCWRPQIRLP